MGTIRSQTLGSPSATKPPITAAGFWGTPLLIILTTSLGRVIGSLSIRGPRLAVYGCGGSDAKIRIKKHEWSDCSSCPSAELRYDHRYVAVNLSSSFYGSL